MYSKQFDGSVLKSVWWEVTQLKKLLKLYKRQAILLNLDGNYLGPYSLPVVTMSRDMLSFEPGMLRLYFFSKFWIRNIIIKYKQTRAVKRSHGVIFLSKYACNQISTFTG